MPLYEYECRKCHHHFEKIESVKSSATKKCPNCGGVAERLLAAPAIQFKGSGWYVTDYARQAASGDGQRDSKAPKESKEAKEGKEAAGKKEEKPKKEQTPKAAKE